MDVVIAKTLLKTWSKKQIQHKSGQPSRMTKGTTKVLISGSIISYCIGVGVYLVRVVSGNGSIE